MTTKTGRPPAMNRRIVLYDLNDQERVLLRKFAEDDNRTLSRWVADAVRKQLEFRVTLERASKK